MNAVLSDIGIAGGILFIVCCAGIVLLFGLAVADRGEPQPRQSAGKVDDDIDVPDWLTDGRRG
jgi:hypothetical protein